MCKKVTGYHLYKNVDGVNNGYYELWRMAGKALIYSIGFPIGIKGEFFYMVSLIVNICLEVK